MVNLGDRERAALKRAGFDGDEIAEIEAAVIAGEIVVVLERGEARVVPTSSEKLTAPEEER